MGRKTVPKQSRKFGRKWFSWVKSKRTKADARKYAEWCRRNGYNARVVKGRDHRGKIIYRIYESDSKASKYWR